MQTTEPISNELAYPGFVCDSDIVNAYYVGVHAITKTRYDQMCNDFFKPNTVPNSKRFRFDSWDINVTCNDHCLQFEIDESNKRDNDNINADVTMSVQIIGKYSIQFLSGLKSLLNLQPGDIFEFCKAQNSAGKATVALRVLRDSGAVLYHGDLTNMYP